MSLPIYQVDAFTSEKFKGNPAAIMPLPYWLDDATLQSIAMENNLSETAFFVAIESGYELRWFTPSVEVDLCGHATLASAHVLFEHLACQEQQIIFHTRSGELRVQRSDGGITLDFPAASLVPAEVDGRISKALGAEARAASADHGALMMVYLFENEAQVAALRPDFRALLQTGDYAVIATAAGDHVDFVSRFFGPQVGIDEDPVTGSAHCLLTPFWAQRLGKNHLQARQISARGGDLSCELGDGRVMITGSALTFMQGTVTGFE